MNVLPEDPPRPREANDFPPRGPNSLASISQRAAARSIDIVLELIPAIVVTFFLASRDDDLKLSDVVLWLTVLTIVVALVYETVLVAWRGQTLGKMILRVRAARLIGGTTPDVTQSTLRALVPVSALALPAVGVALYLLVFLTAMFNPLSRGIHDYAAGTVVVRTR